MQAWIMWRLKSSRTLASLLFYRMYDSRNRFLRLYAYCAFAGVFALFLRSAMNQTLRAREGVGIVQYYASSKQLWEKAIHTAGHKVATLVWGINRRRSARCARPRLLLSTTRSRLWGREGNRQWHTYTQFYVGTIYKQQYIRMCYSHEFDRCVPGLYSGMLQHIFLATFSCETFEIQ